MKIGFTAGGGPKKFLRRRREELATWPRRANGEGQCSAIVRDGPSAIVRIAGKAKAYAVTVVSDTAAG